MIPLHRSSKGSLRIRRPQCSLVGAHLTEHILLFLASESIVSITMVDGFGGGENSRFGTTGGYLFDERRYKRLWMPGISATKASSCAILM